MSKLVVKIRDDDKNFPHCPLHHDGYCHLPQTHYYSGNALYMQQCLGFINKRPNWCPLKEEKEAIPIEWLNKRAEEIAFAYWTNARNKITLPLNELPLLIDQIIGEWEKENGK